DKIAGISRKLDAKENEFKLTKSMVDNLEGFPESIKFLKNSKDWKVKAPLLSDIIYVNEEYRVAIENYLDPYLNYYVVDDTDGALDAVKLLNRTQKGKANFFILDAFTDYAPSMTTFGNFTRATELVEVDGKYTHLVSHLLSNVFLTEKEVDQLTEKVEDNNIVLLSQSGGFIKKKFSLSGGSVGLFEGKKIGRKKNLEVLEKAISELDKQKDKLTSTLLELKSNLKALKESSSKVSINTEKQLFNQLTNQKVSIQTRLENFESFAGEITTKIEQNQLQISKIKDQNTIIDQELAEKRKVAEQSKSKLANTDDSFKEVANKMSVANHAFNEKNIAFIKQQNMVNSIQQELTFREKQLRELKEKLENDTATINSSDGEITELLKQMKVLDAKLLDAYEIKKERSKTLGSAEQAYFKARGFITEMEDELRKSNRKYLDTQSLINNLKDKFNDIKLSLSSIGERIKLEFQISINEVIKMEPKEGINRTELQGKVDKLKKRLDNYGEINPMAVEAYNEIKERYDTITQQRDDVITAKNSLIETIAEIETTATTQFMEAFEKVRVAFIEVFQSLFTENDICDLVLEDPDNPLESRIKITAKPKGKRPQSISQLSGGEKTLTATALLFALYLLKPAPFCIFDEVDAPLDDANIEKFNNIIKKFAEKSQFIVVTHNKQTMAAVDVIYGVHMQEMGVSSVTPVDFRTLEHSNILQAAEG
ncbi:MAG: AAA family ATPase, partial [Bacteroidota bacterium]